MYTHFLKKPFLHRTVASLLLINMLSQLVFPLAAHALTAGPTAPEATSFEPVDTTDMVNLQSGDFTYNIPLLEVPGPEGGYPLSLSYHAGIQPNEEASWVGLGWTLNPGAITRNVNGYADDHKGVNNVVRDYWHGGERSTYNVGVTVGLGNSPASATFGLAFSQDTYQGFGMGASVGLGGRLGGANSPFGAGITVGVGPYGGAYASAGLNAGIPIGKAAESSSRLGIGLGVSTNFESISMGGNIGLNSEGRSVLGVSLSSSGSKPSLSIGGATASVNNQSFGKISSFGSSVGIDIPMPAPGVWVNLGYSYQRYWSDETNTVATFGTLYEPRLVASYDNNAFDTYSLLDTDKDITINSDPEKVLGGSFPSYDNYYVVAQGLSGSMRPYWFRKKLRRQNKKRDDTYQVKQYNYRHNHEWNSFEKPGFRFDNDFSNRFLYEGGTFAYYPSGDAPLGEDYFSTAPETGIYSPDNSQINRLPGSRNIEWFTNREISTGAARVRGFVETNSSGFTRCGSGDYSCDTGTYGDMIGGFAITNESGVTYHYALPAYSYDEEIYTESVKRSPLDNNRPESFNSLKKPNRYAYTWYLTAITGPDYVDKNSNGWADSDDWGYWVNFNYGQWAKDYVWRNPSEGFHKDIDNSFQSYSIGKKELYYLDAIQTRTHTALFSKEMRNDGKGISGKIERACFTQDHLGRPVATDVFLHPRTTLRLNEILLVNNSDLRQVVYNHSTERPSPGLQQDVFVLQLFKRLSTAYDHSWPIGSCSGTGPGPDQVHSGSYVLDKFDIEQIGDAITAASVRKIVLNTDYSLSPGTFNSYAERTDAPINNTPVVKTGKLTLKSVSFLGKGGADLTPPLRFEYDLPQDQQKRIAIFVASLDPSTRRGTVNAGTGLREGDLITFPIGNNRQAYAVILSEPTIGTSTYKVYYLTDLMPTVGLGYNTVTTKNPPYNKDASDMWGMYKADYRKMENENLSRIVTDVSAKSLDVWNLRRITTPLGAVVSVGYEADDYQRAVLAKQSILRIKNVEFLPDRKFKVYFWENENVDELLNIGDTYGSLLYAGYEKTNGKLFCDRDADGSYEENCGCEGCSGTTHTPAFIESKTMTLRELSSNYAIFQDSELYTKLTQRRELTGSAFYAVACGNRPLRLPCIYVSQGLPEAIFGGYLFSPSNYETKGGGVRVSSIQLSHDNVDKFTTYTYKNNLQSSGFTSYEPIRVIEPIVQLPDNFASIGGSRESYIIAFTRELRNKAWSAYSSLLMLAWEIPAPGVTYEHVTVEEYIKYADEATPKQMPGKTTYEFEVFKENMVRRRVLNNQNYNLIDNDVQGIPLENGNRIKTRRLAMEDYTTRLGGLRRVVRYDKQGNKLTETVNHYLHDGLENDSQAYKAAMNRFNNQGVIQENFADARFVKQDDGKYDLLGVMSRREQYPSIQTGTTTINYRTGLQERTENLAFDFYSGALTKSLTVDGYGNRFMSVSVPAYTQYPAMGLKTVSATNKHMLTQTAASYVYKVDAQNNPVGLLGASVQTWSDRQPVLEAGRQVGIWRKEASYSFVPQGNHSSGITPMERFIDFNFTSASTSNPNWRKEGEITLYDVNSKALEATDMNGNHAATKLGYNQTRPIATGTLANYHEIAFSGAEDALAQDMFGGGVLAKLPGANSASVAVVSGTAHSGAKSLQINGGQSGFIYRNNVSEEKLQAGRKYIARVWVRNSAQGTTPTLPADARLYYKINGQTYTSASPVAEKQADGWYALHFTVAVPADALGELEVGCLNAGSTPLYFDDFRFQPQDGGMTAYVYDTFSGELTYILDNNNLYTRYEYDAVGRLVRTYRETFQYGVAKIKETRYNYARK